MISPKFLADKKSQTELLGFAIVVLLLAVGMLFIIGYIIMEPPSNSRAIYIQKQIATNMNDALLETTTACNFQSVHDLLLGCARGDATVCNIGTGTSPPVYQPVCDYVHDFIADRLDETLSIWSLRYNYTIRHDTIASNPVWSHAPPGFYSASPKNNCGTRQRSPLIFNDESKSVIIYLDMYLCKN